MADYGFCKPLYYIFLIIGMADLVEVAAEEQLIPTTLDGPFKPVTMRLDPSLRQGSDDLPMNHPRLKRNVTSMFPEQIALALSAPASMWVSWVTGMDFVLLFTLHKMAGSEVRVSRLMIDSCAVHYALLSTSLLFSIDISQSTVESGLIA